MKSPPLVAGADRSEHQINTLAHTPNQAAHATNFRRIEKNSLRGFFDIELPSGLKLCGCSLHFSTRYWVGFPARPYTDDSGKQPWAKIVDFTSTEARDRFQRIALAAAMLAFEEGSS